MDLFLCFIISCNNLMRQQQNEFCVFCCHSATKTLQTPCLWALLGGGRWVAGGSKNRKI
jgi:hypothetical protein